MTETNPPNEESNSKEKFNPWPIILWVTIPILILSGFSIYVWCYFNSFNSTTQGGYYLSIFGIILTLFVVLGTIGGPIATLYLIWLQKKQMNEQREEYKTSLKHSVNVERRNKIQSEKEEIIKLVDFANEHAFGTQLNHNMGPLLRELSALTSSSDFAFIQTQHSMMISFLEKYFRIIDILATNMEDYERESVKFLMDYKRGTLFEAVSNFISILEPKYSIIHEGSILKTICDFERRFNRILQHKISSGL